MSTAPAPGGPSAEQVRAALREVLDPCSRGMARQVNIVDLGLVDEIEIDASKVSVSLVLTDPACPFRSQISTYVTDVLRERLGLEEVSVQMRHDKIWLPDVSRLLERRARMLPIAVSARPGAPGSPATSAQGPA